VSGPEKYTIAIPCLNEEANIAQTLEDIYAMIPKLGMDEVQVIMVDDGSTDRTRDVMASLTSSYPNCHMVVNSKNIGPGRSVTQLWADLDPDSWFTALPGDNEIIAASLLNHGAMRANHDVILGYLQNNVIRPPVRRLASAVFQTMARSFYGLPFRYFNGPKLYRIWAFQGIDIVGGGHAFNAELLAKAILRHPHLRIGEAPFVARGRAGGMSKAFTPKFISRAARDFFRGQRSVVELRNSRRDDN
jgi:glycosyltransferase involved in cell wall biosynthesis